MICACPCQNNLVKCTATQIQNVLCGLIEILHLLFGALSE